MNQPKLQLNSFCFNEKQVESGWVTCAKISRGSGECENVRKSRWAPASCQRPANGEIEITRKLDLTHPADSAFQLKRVTTLVTEYGLGMES